MDILNIIEGNINRVLNKNKELSEYRLQICKACPLYSQRFGGQCNNKLWLDPISGKVSVDKVDDRYKKGCGCIILSKVAATNSKCPAGKW